MKLQILEKDNLFQGNGFFAKKRESHIEVWSADGEKYLGNTPLDFTLEQIEVTVRFAQAGEEYKN